MCSRKRYVGTLALVLGAAAGCADDPPTGLRAPAPPSFQLTGGLAERDTAFARALDNELRNGAGTIRGLGNTGGAAQLDATTRARQLFPTEGASYVVVSSGDATAVDDPLKKNTRISTTAFPYDVAALDVTLEVPQGATSVLLDLRYFSWDNTGNLDPFTIKLLNPNPETPGFDVASGQVNGESRTLEWTTATAGFTGAVTSSAPRWGRQDTVAVTIGGYVNVDPTTGVGTVTLRLEASDSDNGSGAGAGDSGALIDNIRIETGSGDRVAPVVSSVALDPTPVPIGQRFRLAAAITDPSGIDRAEYAINDGAIRPMLAGATTWTAETLFTTSSVFTLCARGEDAAGNVSKRTCIEQAVYDPNGSYVTGSGTITSPAGAWRGVDGVAFTADDNGACAMTDRASFGFSSKYKVGANTPSGTTRFTFRQAGFEFNSTIYYWLVTSGTSSARYKGRGTVSINDVPLMDDLSVYYLLKSGYVDQSDYEFLLSAVDGANAGGPDRFRIKVWHAATGQVVYDNHRASCSLDDPLDPELKEDATPKTVVETGGIMIKR